ncbi:MAG: hypothetical protein M5U09_27210 [Gammaproteobacteria bacterium]|nr:hypothetical protein [Gammaproteobacteria bacterium]
MFDPQRTVHCRIRALTRGDAVRPRRHDLVERCRQGALRPIPSCDLGAPGVQFDKRFLKSSKVIAGERHA